MTLRAYKDANLVGFQMDFPNGYTISVMFASQHYCDARAKSGNTGECANAEVAAWNTKTGDWYQLGDNDSVIGWQDSAQVAALIAKIAALPSVVE